MRITRSQLNTACKRRIKRLEEETGRMCRRLAVTVIPRKDGTKEKYVFGAFVAGRHDRAVFTIGYWEDAIQRFIPAN